MGITFKEIGDECGICPLSRAGICKGLANYGGEPVYPPCSELPEDTDAEKWLKDWERSEAKRLRGKRRYA